MAFTSRAPRKTVDTINSTNSYVGPGCYELSNTFSPIKHKIPPNYGFTSCSDRGLLHYVIDQNSLAGPGSYFTYQILSQSNEKTSAFKSTSQRFDPTLEKQELPGPGSYDLISSPPPKAKVKI